MRKITTAIFVATAYRPTGAARDIVQKRRATRVNTSWKSLTDFFLV